MSYIIPALCLDTYSGQMMADVLRVTTEMAFKNPEIQAAFEKWKAEREEAANASKQ